MVIPSIIFIIPYREREEQRFVFEKYMKYILEDYKKHEYEIYFVEQCDHRDFNRGALKNVGFLTMKEKYPNDYKNITFVFNDVDTYPYKKGLLPYKTKQGIIKHFFGFEYTLGGIFSICGADFERIGGFPNFWTWGYEDNIIYNKAVKCPGIFIDRSTFFQIFDHKIVHMTDSLKRTINVNQVDDKDPVIEKNNTLDCVANIKYSFHGTTIKVTAFDVYLPYEEKINKFEIKLTDNPKYVQNMKKQFVMEKAGKTRNMRFT
jgi:hypothetical protein